jgi:hypothetical protein
VVRRCTIKTFLHYRGLTFQQRGGPGDFDLEANGERADDRVAIAPFCDRAADHDVELR